MSGCRLHRETPALNVHHSTVLVSVVAAADDAAMKIIHMKNVSVVYARISEAK